MLREERAAVMPLSRFWLVLCTLALWCFLAAQAQAAGHSLTSQEKYVLQQMVAGREADLKGRFGEQDENRILSARFLEDLLTGAYKIHRKGVRIKNAVVTEPLDLLRARIPHPVDLVDCRFRERVDFHSAVFDNLLIMTGSHFDQGADFNTLKVETARFDNAVFKGPVDFIAADIRGQFIVRGARFEGQGEANTANFYSLKVGLDAFFEGVTFRGPVDFVTANIRGNFSASEAKFESTEYPADFNGLKVAQSAFFDKAVFKGPVDFVTADIGGQFNAEGARFESPEHPAKFAALRVGQSAGFMNVSCRHDVNLTFGSFLDLVFQGAEEEKQGEGGSQTTLQLTGTQVQRQLIVADLQLKSLKAEHLRVKGPASFKRLKIDEKADFRKAALETLEFAEITWPERPEKNLKLDGLTYTSISVEGPDYFDRALDLVQRSAFNPQNYGQLEDYCKRRGNPDWADTVVIAMKDRELDQRPWYVRWLKKLFWGWPAGYGRKPMRLLAAGLIIILTGAVLFNPKYLEKDKNPLKGSLPADPEYGVKENKPTPGGKLRGGLLRFLISLDQFLPAVNLRLADHWKAKDAHFLVWLFFTVEQGLGWIFVSIGLTALYTQIK